MRIHCKTFTPLSLTLTLFLVGACVSFTARAQTTTVGMTESRQSIDAHVVPAHVNDAPTVIVVGGLSADGASSNAAMAGYEVWRSESQRLLGVSFVPHANPDAARLQFPPQGSAYEDDWTGWSLWRWLGLQGPDHVIIMGADEYGLGPALEDGIPGLGGIPYTLLDSAEELQDFLREQRYMPISDARATLDQRRERSAADIAAGLGDAYGQETPGYLTYIPGMALIGRMRLGQIGEVQALMDQYLDDNPDPAIENSLQIAGHLVFAELAQRTGESRYLEAAVRVAQLGFNAQGDMREAMPFHGEYSDAFFMATPLLAKVGKLTGETRYFDLAQRHVEYMHGRLLREDGLYDHWPRAEAAWGRGNAFVTLGLALALSDFPEDHPGYTRLLEIYRAHMDTLITHVDIDGMWHNVINIPGSWAELSATAMIATALQRGIDRGWMDSAYQRLVNRSWQGALQRTDDAFGFVNVCASTPGQESLEAYLNRAALSGRDDRAGGMMLMFATEKMQSQPND